MLENILAYKELTPCSRKMGGLRSPTLRAARVREPDASMLELTSHVVIREMVRLR